MQLTNASLTDWHDQGSLRSNKVRERCLLKREGTRPSFEFILAESFSVDHFSPRHRHNFDQIRIGLAGVQRYGKKTLREGTIGYFPEGTHYGPHTIEDGRRFQATLQFDGAGPDPYPGLALIEAATQELRKKGEFRKGIYYPPDGKGMEGYQAVWQELTGKPISYDSQRYDDPIFMHFDAFNWQPSSEANVESKVLGCFGERGLRISMAKAGPGARHRIFATAQSVVGFILRGQLEINGESFGEHSALLSDPGDELIVASHDEATEIIEITLPSYTAAKEPAASSFR